MKKTLFFLLAAMCAVNMSAQNHLLRVWRGGQKLFETKIEENDSITFQQLKGFDDSDLSPEKATFTYENWRNVDDIYIYTRDGNWRPVYLPWATSSNAGIPSVYNNPQKELANDSTPRWELAFNKCYERKLFDSHMFGLWDKENSKMRIYRFLEGLPNGNSSYCYYDVMSDENPSFVDRDAAGWLSSDSTLKQNKNPTALSDKMRPSDKHCQVTPITGISDEEGHAIVKPGWHCIELNFNSGIFPVSLADKIFFSLNGMQEFKFEATGITTGLLKGKNGEITVPGNKYKQWGGIVTASGEFLSGIASSIAEGVTVGTAGGSGSSTKAWGVLTGILGAVGTGISTAGKIITANEEGKKTKLALSLDFQISDTTQFKGNLKTPQGSEVFEIQMKYSDFFKYVLEHRSQQKSSKRRVNNNGEEIISIGAWNLKSQPVLYVCNDARFTSPERDGDYTVLASFLDPASIELMLNTQNILFDIDNVDSVKLVAYDFSFVSNEYTLSAQPFYDYYGIHQDTLLSERILAPIPDGEDGYKMFLLNQVAEYQTAEKSDGTSIRQYTGIKNIVDKSQPEYDQVTSPAIGLLRNSDNHWLSEIGVAVILEITFKNGNTHVFAERFLPEIRTFSLTEAAALKEQLQNVAAPTTVEGIVLEDLLFDQQKAKALRVLGALEKSCSDKYPIVRIDNVPYSKAIYNSFGTTLEGSDISYDYGYGIRVRDYKDEDNPGIVIRTLKDDRHDYFNAYTARNITWPLYSDLVHLSEYLQTLNDWDTLNRKLEQCGMYSLNHFYYSHSNALFHGYNIQTQESGPEWDGGIFNVPTDAGYIQVYHEDKDGNLTPIGETY